MESDNHSNAQSRGGGLTFAKAVQLIAWLALAAGVATVLLRANHIVGYKAAGPELAVGTQQNTQASSSPGARPVSVKPAELTMDELKFAAAVLNPEIMVHAPRSDADFRSGYRSPCYTEPGTDKLRCLPGLLVLGGFHSGARTIVHALQRHPHVALDASSNDQFWAEEGKTMARYLEGFSAATQRAQGAPNLTLIADVSLSTFTYYIAHGAKAHRAFGQVLQPCHENCSRTAATPGGASTESCMESHCLPAAREADKRQARRAGIDYLADQHVPLLMRAVYQGRPPKLIAVVRDPVERLHSAYYGYPHYHGKFGNNPEGFLAYVKEQVAAFNTCAAKYGDKPCAFFLEILGIEQEKVYFHCDQLLRGMYSVWVEGWLRFFPGNQLLLVKSEELFKNTTAVLQQVLQHTGLEDVGTRHLLDGLKVTGHSAGKQMLPEAEKLLREFYRPFNARLAAMTGDDRYLEWNSMRGQGPASSA